MSFVCDSRVLGALAAAAAFLLSVDAGRDGAGQGYGADGAARHLSAGHLLLDRWRRTGKKTNNNRWIKEVRLKEDIWDWAATCENVYESSFNIGGVQRWSLHEHEAFLLWGGESTRKEKFTINQWWCHQGVLLNFQAHNN